MSNKKINVFAKSMTVNQDWNNILRTFRTFAYGLSNRWNCRVMKCPGEGERNSGGRAQSIILLLHLHGTRWRAHRLHYTTLCTSSQIPNFCIFFINVRLLKGMPSKMKNGQIEMRMIKIFRKLIKKKERERERNSSQQSKILQQKIKKK